MKAIDVAVLKTLAYADIFDQAMSESELRRLLIEHKTKASMAPDVRTVKGVQSCGDVFFLSGRSKLLELKQLQSQVRAQKLKKAGQFLWIFKLVPWIKLVAVSGSVAGGTPAKDDDIDLFIITDRNRLWLARLTLILLLNLVGKRRKPSDDPAKVSDKYCLNMWLTLDDLDEKNHDIYTANEIAHLVPLLNRGATYERYVVANPWIEQLLPNFYNSLSMPGGFEVQKGWKIVTFIDNLTNKLQQRVMRSRTNETVTPNRLAFHPHDYRKDILKRYRAKLRELKID